MLGAGAASVLVYVSLEAPVHPSLSGGPVGAQFPGCGRIPLASPGEFEETLSSTTSCVEGAPGWGASISIAWVSINGTANIAATWSCLGAGCVALTPTTVYDQAATEGSFSFSVSELGPQWENVSAIDFVIWASPASNPGASLLPGEGISMVGVVR